MSPTVAADVARWMESPELGAQRGDAATPPAASCFDGARAAPIALADYAARIARFARPSDDALLCAAVLLQRVTQRHPHLSLTHRNAHRLLLAAVVIAAKARDDEQCTHAHYAAVGGVLPHELGALERALLGLLDFDIALAAADVRSAKAQMVELRRACCPRAHALGAARPPRPGPY